MLSGKSLEEGRSLLLMCLLRVVHDHLGGQSVASGALSSKPFGFCKKHCPSSTWKNETF